VFEESIPDLCVFSDLSTTGPVTDKTSLGWMFRPIVTRPEQEYLANSAIIYNLSSSALSTDILRTASFHQESFFSAIPGRNEETSGQEEARKGKRHRPTNALAHKNYNL
jgi:hypothetical protein